MKPSRTGPSSRASGSVDGDAGRLPRRCCRARARARSARVGGARHGERAAHVGGAARRQPARGPEAARHRCRQGHASRAAVPEPSGMAPDRVRRAAPRRDPGALLDALEARGDRLRPAPRRCAAAACARRIPQARLSRRPDGAGAGARRHRAGTAPRSRVSRPASRDPARARHDGAAARAVPSAGTSSNPPPTSGFLDAPRAHRVADRRSPRSSSTSGTTAQAKAVVHTHGALTISGRRIADASASPDDAWWGHMPLF